MIKSSPIKSSAMIFNIDIAIVITSLLLKFFQMIFIESSQMFIEIFINRIFKKQFWKIKQKWRFIINIRERFVVNYNKQIDITSFFIKKNN